MVQKQSPLRKEQVQKYRLLLDERRILYGIKITMTVKNAVYCRWEFAGGNGLIFKMKERI